MPPKLPPNPFKEGFPKPPRISQILKKANPVREVVDDARQLIQSGRDEISGVASALRVEGAEAPPAPPEEEAKIEEDEIKGGTAGSVCTDEHFGQSTADITEALRMARSRGIKDAEIRKRLRSARSELDQMERFDMVPEKIETYPPAQREIAEWILPKSSAARHAINELLMRGGSIEDLEKLEAYMNRTDQEFIDRLDALPEEVKASDACLEIKRLSTFIEEQRLKKGEVGIGDVKKFVEGRE